MATETVTLSDSKLADMTTKAEPIRTARRLALDAAGAPVDMPGDLASDISYELHNVLTLLHAAMDQVDTVGTLQDADPDNITDAKARSATLMRMGYDKVRVMIKQISPYV